MSREEEAFLTLPGLAQLEGINHLFGTRLVDATSSAAGFLGEPAYAVMTVKQVHGDDVLVVESSSQNPDRGYDALLTQKPGILLLVSTADCVPILLADPIQRVVASVHAGWRGSVRGIVAKVVRKMKEQFGSHPGSVQVGIGPSAGRCCYEVDKEVLEPLKDQFPNYNRFIDKKEAGRGNLDLPLLNKFQLMEIGVSETQIQMSDVCTICSPELFYSYRREGHKRKVMFSGIVLRPA